MFKISLESILHLASHQIGKNALVQETVNGSCTRVGDRVCFIHMRIEKRNEEIPRVKEII